MSDGKLESSPATPSLQLNELQGDLFAVADDVTLCHCISRDVAMGKGIAVEFKKRFQGVDEIKNQNKGIGEVAVLHRGRRWVYYLITKERYFNKPTHDQLAASLTNMKHHMIANGVIQLAMPRIGCGLGN